MIRVVLADDHQVVRQGVRAVLEKAGDIVVVGEAEDGQAALELVERLAPDVLVLDIAMPHLNGIQTTAELQSRQSTTEVVIFSMYADATFVRQALRSGARGYVLKQAALEELMLAIRAASRRETYLSPPISTPILAAFLVQPDADPDGDLFSLLSRREHQVLQLITDGRTNHDIAAVMQISVKTVEKHRTNLMAKLNVHDVAGLVRTAIKHRLILLDD